MTVNHFVFGKKKIGTEAFSVFNQLHLALIDGKERQFMEFLSSPFFNKNERLAELYQRITKANQVQQPNLRAKIILKQWNKSRKQAIGEEYLISAVDKLSQLILEFIPHNKLQESKINHHRILHPALRNKGLTSFVDEVTDAIHEHNAVAPSSFELLLDDFLLHYEAYYELETDREQNGLEMLTALEERCDLLFQSYQAKFAVERFNLEKASKQTTTPAAEPIPAKNRLLLDLYQSCLAIHKKEVTSAEATASFGRPLMSAHERIDPLDRYALCKHYFNFLSRKQKTGAEPINPLFFEWTKRRVEWTPAVVSREGVNDYLNTINVACFCGDIAYAEDYLSRYRNKLPAAYAEKTYLLGLADILFRKQEYLLVIQLLQDEFPKFTDTHYFFMLRSKALKLRASTELLLLDSTDAQDFDFAFDLVNRSKDDLRKYLQRNMNIIPQQFQTTHLAFAQYVSSIVRLVMQAGSRQEKSMETAELEEEIQTAPKLVARAWLLDLIDRLLKKQVPIS